MYSDWVGEEFFPVFVDLRYHFLRIMVLWIVFATREPNAKLLHTIFDSPDVNKIANRLDGGMDLIFLGSFCCKQLAMPATRHQPCIKKSFFEQKSP